MAHRCPFCKARLWSDPWLSGGKLKCPRCDNEFVPKVPWGYFRLVIVLLVLAAILLIVTLPGGYLWLALILVGVALLIWHLPKMISLHPTEALTPSEGVMDPERMKLDLEDADWEERLEELQQNSRFRTVAIAVLLLAIAILLIASILI